jgi:hypothetical protein
VGNFLWNASKTIWMIQTRDDTVIPVAATFRYISIRMKLANVMKAVERGLS